MKKKKKKKNEEEGDASYSGLEDDKKHPLDDKIEKGTSNSQTRSLSTSVTIMQANKTVKQASQPHPGVGERTVTLSLMKAKWQTVETIDERDSPSTSGNDTKEDTKAKNTQRGTEKIGDRPQIAPKLSHRKSLISSMIGALKRKDSSPPAHGGTCTLQSYNNESATNDEESAFCKRGVRSRSITVEVKESNVASPTKGKERQMSTVKSSGIGNDQDDVFLPKARVSLSGKPAGNAKQANCTPKKSTKDVAKRGLLTSDSFSASDPTENTEQTNSSCCVLCLPKVPISSNNNTIEKAPKQKKEQIGNNQRDGESSKKKSFKQRVKNAFTKRNILACFCPCFTYYILDEGRGENNNLEEHQEKR